MVLRSAGEGGGGSHEGRKRGSSAGRTNAISRRRRGPSAAPAKARAANGPKGIASWRDVKRHLAKMEVKRATTPLLTQERLEAVDANVRNLPKNEDAAAEVVRRAGGRRSPFADVNREIYEQLKNDIECFSELERLEQEGGGAEYDGGSDEELSGVETGRDDLAATAPSPEAADGHVVFSGEQFGRDVFAGVSGRGGSAAEATSPRGLSGDIYAGVAPSDDVSERRLKNVLFDQIDAPGSPGYFLSKKELGQEGECVEEEEEYEVWEAPRSSTESAPDVGGAVEDLGVAGRRMKKKKPLPAGVGSREDDMDTLRYSASSAEHFRALEEFNQALILRSRLNARRGTKASVKRFVKNIKNYSDLGVLK